MVFYMRYGCVTSALILGLVAGGGLFGQSAGFDQQFVRNGNFTEGDDGLTGWVANAGVVVAGTVLTDPQSGHPVQLSTSGTRGELSQDLIAGSGSKQVEFYVQGAGSPSTLEVLLGGTSLYSKEPDFGVYKITNLSGPSTLLANPTLVFKVTSGSFGNILVSNVSVTEQIDVALAAGATQAVEQLGAAAAATYQNTYTTQNTIWNANGMGVAPSAYMNQLISDVAWSDGSGSDGVAIHVKNHLNNLQSHMQAVSPSNAELNALKQALAPLIKQGILKKTDIPFNLRRALSFQNVKSTRYPFQDSSNEHMEEVALEDLSEESSLVAGFKNPFSKISSDKKKKEEKKVIPQKTKMNVWGRALGQYIRQDEVHSSPSYGIGSGGAAAGTDWTLGNYTVGVAGSYVFSYVFQSHDAGHADVNQGMLGPYGSARVDRWVFDFSLLGGYSHVHNQRNFSSGSDRLKATSNTQSGQLAPHAGIAYQVPHFWGWFFLEPFTSADWVANWQEGYQEKGASGFNMGQNGSFSSFIKTETGIRFREELLIEYGLFTISEKVSYGYQRGFTASTSSVFVVGTPSAFIVGNTAGVQNLGIVEFGMTFDPIEESLPIVAVAFQGQFGSVFRSYSGSVNLSKKF